MQKTRVCIFCESWESGGIESFLNNILLHMDLDNLEIDLVAESIRESVFTAGLKEKGICFIELSGKQRSFRNFALFQKLLRQRRYHIVHLNLFQGLSLCYARIAKQEGIPVRIAHSHNTALRKSAGRWLKLMIHRMGSHLFTNAATDLWACSGEAAKFLFPSSVLRRKGYRYIPNGIQTGRFRFNAEIRAAIRTQLSAEDSFLIGNVGRLCYQKNQSFLLDIFHEVLQRKPESKLLLVGEGEDEAALKQKAQQLGISDRVIFFGVTDQVEKLFFAMDAFVFPSRFEGLGIVSIEAQAAGLPVLCSENIPSEAHVTEWIKASALRDGPGAWAEQLFAIRPISKREDAAQAVNEAGFDVTGVSALIRKEYETNI